jgi:hypothetical protein
MTEQQARTTANVLMAAAALGAAVFVLRSPKWRRLAFQLARDYARGPLAAVVATTIRNAWDDSAQPDRGELRPAKDVTPAVRGSLAG